MIATAPVTDLASELAAIPSNAQLVTPSTNTHPNVSHRCGEDGRFSPKSSFATASRSTASARLDTATRMILPRKYDVAGSGVPRRRLSVPSSRSDAMPPPMLTNDVDTMPEPIMPAANACAASPKIEPSSTMRNAGRVNVNTTASLSRKNWRSSTPPRAIPSAITSSLRSAEGRRLRGSAG